MTTDDVTNKDWSELFFNCIFTILLSLFRIKIYLQQYFIWLCCDNNNNKKKYNFKIKL